MFENGVDLYLDFQKGDIAMVEVLESPPKLNVNYAPPSLYQVRLISMTCGYKVTVGTVLRSSLSSIFQCSGLEAEQKILYDVQTGQSISFGVFIKEVAQEKACQANAAISKKCNIPGAVFFFE